jgi:hypothetical protein
VMIIEHHVPLLMRLCDRIGRARFRCTHRPGQSRRRRPRPQGDRGLPGRRCEQVRPHEPATAAATAGTQGALRQRASAAGP